MGQERLYIIRDKKTGEVKIEVRGVKGPRCQQVTEKLEAGLGSVKSKDFTSEYFDQNVCNEQKNWGGN